jgi:hypothetical protein
MMITRLDHVVIGVRGVVENLDAARDWFARHGIELDARSVVPLERPLGAQLVFVA